MLADAEAKVAGGGEVGLLQLELLDLRSSDQSNIHKSKHTEQRVVVKVYF